MRRILHTVSEDREGLMRDYSGDFLCCSWLSQPSCSLVQLLLVVSLWYYQYKVTPKPTSQTESIRRRAVGDLEFLQGRDDVAHRHRDQSKK